MFAVFRTARKAIARLIAPISLVALAACEPVSFTAQGPSINTSKPVPVALLVPAGSGNAGDEILAKSLENAARMAIADLDGANIDLRVYHTAANADQAAAQASTAVKEGAKIILGPVYSASANAAAVAVAPQGINVLSFSNNPEIAGGNLFILGPTFPNTADRLIKYAAAQGKGDVVIVHDTSVAGQLGQAAIAEAVRNTSGASLVASVPYERSQQGVIQAIPSIRSATTAQGADSIFLTAVSDGALPLLSQLISEAGIDPAQTQYIGLTRWDVPPQTLELPGLQGGWFALPDPAQTQRFASRYAATYGGTPHNIGGLAYDGVAAIGALVSAGNSGALTSAALTQGSGFQGVNGIFRLRRDGTNDRGLAVAQIQNKQVVIVSPAPRSFGGAGF